MKYKSENVILFNNKYIIYNKFSFYIMVDFFFYFYPYVTIFPFLIIYYITFINFFSLLLLLRTYFCENFFIYVKYNCHFKQLYINSLNKYIFLLYNTDNTNV